MASSFAPPPATASAARVHPTAYVAPGVQLADDVVVGPAAVLLAADAGEATTEIAQGVQIGGNATIYPGCHVGLRARIAPGAVVQRSVPPLALVEGNPGRIVGYVESAHWQAGSGPTQPADKPRQLQVTRSRVRGVCVHHLPVIDDLRGMLSPAEIERDVPFAVQRYFLVYGVPSAETRGEHAHHKCAQFLLAVSGSVRVLVDDGVRREEFLLDRPNLGLLIPPMVWGVQYRYQPDSVLLVLASEHYDAADYIRDYGEFVALVQANKDSLSPATDPRCKRLPPATRVPAAATASEVH